MKTIDFWNEDIISIIRRHYIIFLFLFLYIFWLFIIIFFISLFYNQIISVFWEKIFYGFMSIFIIINISIFFIIWVHWNMNVVILTHKNIYIIKQISLLNREIIEIQYSDIEEIKSKIQWFFSTVFHYGDIMIKTAWWTDDLHIKYIHKPNEIIKKINDIIQKNK